MLAPKIFLLLALGLMLSHQSRSQKIHITSYICSDSLTTVHMGEMVVPKEKEQVFKEAACMAVQILYSKEFRKELTKYIANHTNDGDYAEAWQGWDVDKIISGLKEHINGITVITDGSPAELWDYTFFGNLAWDGDSSGPIRLNQFGLNRDAASIANSFIHEVSHRAGMGHPHSSIRGAWETAICEPPYVIGSILEKIAKGNAWTWKKAADCKCLK